MTSPPWFRFYSEALNDRKILRVCRETEQPKALVIGVWTTILALASDSPRRGLLLFTDDIPLTFDDLELETGLYGEQLIVLLDTFRQFNMLTWNDGVYCVANWDKRQFASDHSTDRVREWRERQKENGSGEEEGNDSETLEGNNDETLQKRCSNRPETEAETETKTETEEDFAADAAQAPPTPPPKQPQSRQKTPTPEAVRVFRANAHRYPSKSWYADVDSIVGTEPSNLAFWGEVVKAWVGLGWNPTNVKGMLDCYQRREIPGNGKPPGQRPTKGLDASKENIAQWMASKGEPLEVVNGDT